MPSVPRELLALFGVQRCKRHADFQFAVPGVCVRGAVLRALQRHLGRVASQLAQSLRDRHLDLLRRHIGQGV